jgi:TolB protein
VQDLAWSPDGRQLAYALATAASTGAPPNRTADIQWVSADGGPPTEVIGAEAPAESGFILAGWSPDASQILYWEYPLFSSSLLADGTPLMMVDTGGGAPRQVAESMLAHADLLAWSADGASLAVVAGAGRSTATNKTLVVTAPDVDPVQVSPPGQAALSPAWSPDGTWIAYAAAPESTGGAGGEAVGGAGTTPTMQRQIWLVRPDGSEAHPLTASAPPQRAERPRWSVDGQSLLVLSIVDADAPRAQLWLSDVAGTQQRLLVDNVSLGGTDPGFYGYVAWDDLLAWWQPPAQDAPHAMRPQPLALLGP